MDDEQTIDLEEFQQSVQEQYGVENVALGVASTAEDAQEKIEQYVVDTVDVSAERVQLKYFQPNVSANEYCEQLELAYEPKEDDVVLVGRYSVDPVTATSSSGTTRESSPGAPGDVDTSEGTAFSDDVL